ncbi:MAG: histidine--tRNA ligase, partial [bacterium]
MKYSAARGTKDILPQDVALWQKLEETCRKIFALYNYSEIRTPIFESTELFARSIGKTTDIVSKEMYEFKDKKGRSLTLRPEETAPVVRASLENNLISPDSVTKLYYIGPMFRYERPQAGRQRQFHQAGIEVFGSSDPSLDAEVILLNLELFKGLGIKELEVNLNSVGCPACRPNYQKLLKEHFKENIKKMCQDCQTRFEHNPLRILDCKNLNCQQTIEAAPASINTLCDECLDHFNGLLKYLKLAKVAFKINNRLVRGLDYYTKTTFEIVSGKLGAQNAVCGGGRYDNLVQQLGGKSIPAVGFAVGLERIIELIKNDKLCAEGASAFGGKISLYIATLGEQARGIGFDLLAKLRQDG